MWIWNTKLKNTPCSMLTIASRRRRVQILFKIIKCVLWLKRFLQVGDLDWIEWRVIIELKMIGLKSVDRELPLNSKESWVSNYHLIQLVVCESHVGCKQRARIDTSGTKQGGAYWPSTFRWQVVEEISWNFLNALFITHCGMYIIAKGSREDNVNLPPKVCIAGDVN